MNLFLLASVTPPATDWEQFWQHFAIGLTNGSLIALIAIGYTMVYGIIGLINFAHGDLFMLGALLSLTLFEAVKGGFRAAGGDPDGVAALLCCTSLAMIAAPLFCAAINVSVERVIYKPLRGAPKLAPLVSAIGVSFIFMNIGLLWNGAADRHFPDFPDKLKHVNLLEYVGLGSVQFTPKDLLVIGVTVPLMLGLAAFVKFTRLGAAMRATEQNPIAARLMGVNVDQVISATFAIGGALAGAASVVYSLYVNTVNFQMGFQNGLYAFTAAVLGGIGNLPGAVLGGIVIGLVRSLGGAYLGERWTNALVFAILIGILVFRPSGLLGARVREKV